MVVVIDMISVVVALMSWLVNISGCVEVQEAVTSNARKIMVNWINGVFKSVFF